VSINAWAKSRNYAFTTQCQVGGDSSMGRLEYTGNYYEYTMSVHSGFWKVTQCHDLAKWLSHYFILLSFSFLFFSYLDLLHKEGVWESITCHSYVSGCHKVMSHNNVT